MSRKMIEIHDLEKFYGAHHVLKKINLDVEEGEVVVIIGPSGSGKSTLLRSINYLEEYQDGTIIIDGEYIGRTMKNGKSVPMEEKKLNAMRQKVGMVFQSPDNQIVATVVEEDVAFALENLGVPPEEMRRRVDDSMKMAGIYEYRERAPHNLSGGQKQRVAIAGVVAMRPDCLILDEATAMLDPRGREQVMQTIHYLNRNMGITVVSIPSTVTVPLSGRRMALKCLARVDLPQPLAPSTATNSPRCTPTDTPLRA